MENLGLTTAQKKGQAQIIAALKAHVDGRINETIERRNLRQCKQQSGESFDDYLVSLRELAKTCNFCNNDYLQKALRDQIIEGLLDGNTIQELLQIKDLMLDQTITKCRGLFYKSVGLPMGARAAHKHRLPIFSFFSFSLHFSFFI